MLKLYNTRTKQKEVFTPLNTEEVSLYTCGPTVYHYAHIGNLRTYVFEDILRRVLEMNKYKVKHVMNITDVGHLTDDGNDGEDKMEKGSKREGKTAWEIAELYTIAFKKDIAALNIQEPTIWCKATDHIEEQIAMVQTLTEKGFTYETSDGIYFDTTKQEDYGKLVNLRDQQLQAGTRVDMGEKKNPHDFALWKFSKKDEERQMEWSAFGKKGFPGWHIECSAMSVKYLGEQFDIHCGGVDHKPVHHTNEIAQTEAALGKKPWVNIWMHGEFLNMSDEKMSKSSGTFITLSDLIQKDFDPLSYRFFLLQAHYRKQLTFSYEALTAAHVGLKKLRRLVQDIETTKTDPQVETKFLAAISDDLNIPEALAVLFTALKEKTVSKETLKQFDKVLGLNLLQQESALQIPAEIQTLLDKRKKARASKDWAKSDELREAIQEKGFIVKDTAEGQTLQQS